jgi:hypothetical protein
MLKPLQKTCAKVWQFDHLLNNQKKTELIRTTPDLFIGEKAKIAENVKIC